MITTTLVILISSFSIFVLKKQKIMKDLMLHPYHFWKQKKYYQLITSGLIHSDGGHLFLNMYALWIFGTNLEFGFSHIYSNSSVYYLVLFFGAIIISSLFDILINNDALGYATLGSSGAVSAVIFASIVIFPTDTIGLIFLPIMIPGWLFGLLYLGYCIFKDYQDNDNVNHMAHFVGGIFGIIFVLLTWSDTLSNFAYQIHAN